MEKIEITCLKKTGEEYYKHTVLFNKQELASFLPDFSSYKQDEFNENKVKQVLIK